MITTWTRQPALYHCIVMSWPVDSNVDDLVAYRIDDIPTGYF
jgi:hypothetical protein